ncbi:MAG: HEAT repeat domain-containing protein [Chitinophagaceae bacterium]
MDHFNVIFDNSGVLLYALVEPTQLWLVATLLLGIIILLTLFIFIHLSRSSAKGRKRRTLEEQYVEFIGSLAICEGQQELDQLLSEPEIKQKLQRWLSGSYSRYILAKELVTTAKSMNGIAAKNICWFYNQATLDKDALGRLRNGEWHIKSKAIQVLAQMDQKQHIARIYRLTNDKNELVRNEARIAVVKLTGFAGLRFLDVISYPLTEWQQLCLLHELAHQKNISFTDINRWLQSANNSVVEFALRLVDTYKVYDLHDEVIKCLLHPSKDIRSKAIRALQEIHRDDTAQILVNHFEKEDEEIQLNILQSLSHTGTEAEIKFLSKTLNHYRDDFKMTAARAIRMIKSDGLKIVEQAINISSTPWSVLFPQLQKEEAI